MKFTLGQRIAIAVTGWAYGQRPDLAAELRTILWRCYRRRGDEVCELMWQAARERGRQAAGIP